MGNITIQGDLTGDVPGGEVGGASNLTTVGAIPYVSASGILNQDPTALFWDAANDRATFGSGVGKVQVGTIVSGVPFPGLWLGDFTPAVTNYVLLADAGSGVALNAPTTSQWISFRAGNTDRMRLGATTGNLLIGTTTDDGTNKLQVAGTAIVNLKAILKGSGASRSESAVIFSDSTGAEGSRRGAIGSEWFTTSGQYGLEFVTAGSLRGGIAYTSGNLIWGSSTYVDNGYKLDVAASGSAGTARFYGGSGVSNSTKVVVQAGAGQSTTNLTEWQDSSGTIVAQFKSSDARLAMGVLSGGSYGSSFRAVDFEAWYGSENPFTGSINQRSMLIGASAAGLRVASDYGMYWSANAAGSGDAYGSLDAGLARRSAGLLQVNSGTSIGTTPGNARDVMLRGVYAAETTSDPSAAELSIAGSNAQDTFRLYMKNDKLVVAYNRSGTVNYLTIPLDGATTTWTQSTTAP